METNKIIEALENLQVGDIIQIEKREGYIDVKRTSGWRPAPRPSDVMCAKCGGSRVLPTGKVKYSNPEHVEYKCKDCNYSFYVVRGVHSNINVHGVDLSILNEEDWFYVEIEGDSWIAKGNIVKAVSESCIHYSIDGSLYTNGMLCYRNSITLLRKATDSDLAPFFEKHPQYAPIEVGDIGLFFDSSKHIKDDRYTIGRLAKIRKGQIYEYEEKYATWKHFFKVSESETIAEIKERFLKENEI